jgi:hypothetical protein
MAVFPLIPKILAISALHEVTAERSEQGGILLIMLEDFFDQNCEEHRMLQAEIHQYLRLDALHQQYVKPVNGFE